MTKPYREQLLGQLADGEWHDAAELAHPVFKTHGLEAFVRVLQAEGYPIEADGSGNGAGFRLRPRVETR